MAALIYSSVFCFFISAETYSDKTPAIEAEENYSSVKGFSGKISAEYGKVNFNVMDFRMYPSGEKDDKTVYNFYSPVFTAGRVRKKGLLKESANPSYWYAGSDTYSDLSELEKDSELERNGKWGIVINPYKTLSVYALTDENDNYMVTEKGAVFNIQLSDTLDASAVFYKSKREESSDEEWYMCRDEEYGENIYHSALRASHSLSFITNTVSGGYSYGKCFKKGKYLRYQPEIDFDFFSLFILISCSDSMYRKNEKGYPSLKLRRGIKAEYEANKYLFLEGGYNIDIFHDDHLSEIEDRTAEKIFLKIKYDAEIFYINLDAERKNSVEEREYLNKDSYGVKTGLRGDYISFYVKPEYTYLDYEAVSKKITFESEIKDSKKGLVLRYKREKNEQLESALKGRLELNGDHVSVYTDAEYATVDEKGVNLKSVFRYSAGAAVRY